MYQGRGFEHFAKAPNDTWVVQVMVCNVFSTMQCWYVEQNGIEIHHIDSNKNKSYMYIRR